MAIAGQGRARFGRVLCAGACATAVGLVLGTTREGYAQALPSTADPTRIDQQLDRLQAPQSEPSLQLQGPEFEPPPAQAFIIRFDLKNVIIEGAEQYPAGTFDGLIAPLRGKEVALLDVYNIRDEITARYRSDGFVLSQALIPAQRIQDGIVRIQVVEGFVGDVRFEGDVSDAASRFAPYVQRLKAERPLRVQTLERVLLLIDDLPGVEARTVLRPSQTTTGATDVVFVLDREFVNGRLTIDNHGSEAIGPIRADGIVQGNLIDGRLALRSVVATDFDDFDVSELALFDGTYTHWVGSAGTQVSVGARRSFSEPGGSSEEFGIDSVTTSYRFGVSHPLIRTRSETLRLFGDFTLRSSKTLLAEGEPDESTLSRDRLRILTAGASYDFADGAGGSNLLVGSVSKGLDILNATETGSEDLTRADGVSDFWKLNLSYQRNQTFSSGVGLVVGGELQYSPQPLLSSEEFGVGGNVFGQAYDPSEITGDIGYALRIELNYGISLEPLRGIQVFGFLDHGGVRNNRAAETDQETKLEILSSLGFGARLSFTEAFGGSFLVAQPLNEHSAEGGRAPRFFFSLNAQF